MADSGNTPLTDEERSELEELRAEKARREEEERARRERAELEALRAEKAAGEAKAAARAARPASASAAVPAPHHKRADASQRPAEKTFAQRMVTSDATDADGIPTMPPAQKIVIAVCAVLVLAFIVWSFIK